MTLAMWNVLDDNLEQPQASRWSDVANPLTSHPPHSALDMRASPQVAFSTPNTQRRREPHSQQVWNRVEQAARSSSASSAPHAHLTPLPTPQQTQQEKFPALGGGSSSSTTAGPNHSTSGGARSNPWPGSSASTSSLHSQAAVITSSSPMA
ncbi:hypothetical protein D9619_005193 [Psilocybe cf. subviscida]|uniref:Uncharacterized protein n=1 Tax=Psilocybe cf. subviscida TaxID=2480587 RepID=A0A8H5BYC6_9AGAR|nr:hypothetical protein D9619_005193 [Psilocybe cf. subviscida]